jgi:hypothetical protein
VKGLVGWGEGVREALGPRSRTFTLIIPSKLWQLVLLGENDTIVDLDDMRFLALQISDSELRLIKDVGHFLPLEKEELLEV